MKTTDGAKAIAILLAKENADKTAEELMMWKFTATVSVPLIAINTTHGTGTEVDRFSVVSVLTGGKVCVFLILSLDYLCDLLKDIFFEFHHHTEIQTTYRTRLCISTLLN